MIRNGAGGGAGGYRTTNQLNSPDSQELEYQVTTLLHGVRWWVELELVET